MTEAEQRPTPGALMSEALAHLTRILRGEMALAQAETTAALRRAGLGLALLAAAVVLAITALNLLSAALVGAIVYAGLSPAWASLVVAAAWVGLAAILVRVGLRSLHPLGLIPVRAMRGLRNDAQTLKQGLTR